MAFPTIILSMLLSPWSATADDRAHCVFPDAATGATAMRLVIEGERRPPAMTLSRRLDLRLEDGTALRGSVRAIDRTDSQDILVRAKDGEDRRLALALGPQGQAVLFVHDAEGRTLHGNCAGAASLVWEWLGE
jgi:hypothetical protein